MKRLILAVVLIAALSAPAARADMHEVEAALNQYVLAKADYAKAVKLIRRRAEQGFFPIQGLLGKMYFKGEGVPQDYVEAHMWFNLAAAQGVEIAKSNRAGIAKLMTPQDISEAQKRALEWKPCGKDRPCP